MNQSLKLILPCAEIVKMNTRAWGDSRSGNIALKCKTFMSGKGCCKVY